jgi:siroheme synthase (precorrin-2 oxidase/ferrochelatase)
VLLAATTGGDSPALAAHIRRKLEQTFGPEYGVLAERLGRLRREVGPSLSPSARTKLWRSLVTDDVLDLVRNNELTALERYIETLIAELNQS